MVKSSFSFLILPLYQHMVNEPIPFQKEWTGLPLGKSFLKIKLLLMGLIKISVDGFPYIF